MELNSESGSALQERVERRSRQRIMVIGMRGLVGVQGGIETHARMIYPLLARLGCDVEVIHRSPYYPRSERRRRWHGIRLTYIWSPTKQSFETGIHTLLAILYAAWRRPDIVHLHAVGPGLLAPIARLLGLRVVLTHHAPDYEREKFAGWEKRLLRAGESLGIRFANRAIAVSDPIRLQLEQRFGKPISCIPNGVPHALRATSTHALERFGLEPGRYVLCVGRLDPVKRHHDLITAFERARTSGWKLVIVGGLQPQDDYCASVCIDAAGSQDIILTGYQHGLALRELYSHAGVFVLASSTEGHPIALLEALRYGIPVLASAIPANLAVPVPRKYYFKPSDIDELTERLKSILDPDERAQWQSMSNIVRERFSWRKAATLTKEVYLGAVRPSSRHARSISG